MKNRISRKTGLMIIAAIEVLFVVISLLGYSRSFSQTFTSEQFQMAAEDGTVTDQGYYTDTSFESQILTTEAIHLKKGIYVAHVSLNNNNSVSRKAVSNVRTLDDTFDMNLTRLIDSDICEFYAEDTDISYRFEVKRDVDVRLNVGLKEGSADGTFLMINSADVTYMKGMTILNFLFKCLLILLIIDLLIYLFIYHNGRLTTWAREHAVLLVTVLACTLISVLPHLGTEGVYFGDDIWYHLSRLKGLYEGLVTGSFPVKIHPGWKGDYGYAAGVGYNDLFLMPSALLMILGFSFESAYKFYILLTSFITALLSFVAVRKISKSNICAAAGCVAYTLLPFRLMGIYTGATVGEYGAYSFLPLAALGIIEIYFTTDKKKGTLLLALGVTGVIGTHVLTTYILAIVIFLFAILFCEKTFTKEVFFSLLKALGMIVVLNLYFLIPLVDYLLTVPMRGSFVAKMWETALNIQELFVAVPDASEITAGSTAYLGVAAAICILCTLVLLIQGRFGKNQSIILRALILDIALCFAVTKQFPYYLQYLHIKPLNEMVRILQFPWHFCDIIACLTLMLFAISCRCMVEKQDDQNMNILKIAFAITVAAFTLLQANQYYQHLYVSARTIDVCDQNVSKASYIVEFALKGAESQTTTEHRNVELAEAGSTAELSDFSARGTNQVVHIAGVDQEQTVLFPLWAYKGYKARGTDGSKLELVEMQDHRIGVIVPQGYEGDIKVSFSEPWYWRVSELISLLGVVWLCTTGIKQLKKDNAQ